LVDAPRRPRASGFGRYPSSRDARMTRALVSGAIGTLVGVPLSTRDTVLWDTSATAAMSRIVAGGRPLVVDITASLA
jgi:hypothetical protein